MKTCLVCRQPRCSDLYNFGDPAICHHFFEGKATEETHPLLLGICEQCATVQCLTPIPPAKLVPRFDWITYNEPEAHLDSMVDTLCQLSGINKHSVVAGLSYKEDTTLRRFRERGFHNTWRMDTKSDLEISDQKAGVEMIQKQIQSSLVPKLHAKYPQPDIMIIRHVLEHTHNTLGFMETFRRLVKPTGYVVFEVPDCARAFDMLDYTTLWEDHTIYFVEPTFIPCLKGGGFSINRFERYRAPYENCLVAITRPTMAIESLEISSKDFQIEQQRALGFAKGFSERKKALRQLLVDWRKRGKIAAFGAGHQLAMFINVMEVADLIEFVVDDHPRKCGLRMPGSRLPIVSSSSLLSENIKLCLSSLGAESEKKVVEKQKAFVENGGVFASIFPISKDSLLNFVAGAADAK
jgi:hypothetical protein